jgi:N-glycosylase/DNA lyase
MPDITLTPNQPFSLDQTLGCGQVFRWDRADNGWWSGVVGNRIIRIRQDGSLITWEGAPAKFIRHYFSLDHDLGSILASLDSDPFIHAAIDNCHGLRLIRQPKWECLISYICSTNSNIPTIRRRIATIAGQYGKELRLSDTTAYSFPEPSDLACSPDSLEGCKLGYRCGYVFKTAAAITDRKKWEESVAAMPYDIARKELMTLPGVGPKAADCILLFAFEKHESFPVDVWIRRIMQQNYLKHMNTTAPLTHREYETIRGFAREHFGEYCGYAQEYLFGARTG